MRAPKGRTAFRCTDCGLRVTGIVVNGRVFPTDRGANPRPGTALPFLCKTCEERKEDTRP